MNLDEFTDLWGEYAKGEVHKYRLKTDEINDIINTKAGNILYRIRRNLIFDLAILLITIVLGIGFILFIQNLIVTLLLGSIIIIFVPFVVMMSRQLIHCRPELIEQSSVKHWIEMVISSTEKYLNRYSKGAVAATILAVPIGAGLGYYFGSEQIEILQSLVAIAQNNRAVWLVSSIAVAVLFLIINYFVTQWYLKKMYGNYLEALKECHNELENNENNI